MEADIIVSMHAADSARLELDARDPNLRTIYLPDWIDARVRTAGARRRLRG
jgi:hypothetical protein